MPISKLVFAFTNGNLLNGRPAIATYHAKLYAYTADDEELGCIEFNVTLTL